MKTKRCCRMLFLGVFAVLLVLGAVLVEAAARAAEQSQAAEPLPRAQAGYSGGGKSLFTAAAAAPVSSAEIEPARASPTDADGRRKPADPRASDEAPPLPLSPLVRIADLLVLTEDRPAGADPEAFGRMFKSVLAPAGFSESELVAFEENPLFTYAVADAYRPELSDRSTLMNVRRLTRHVLLLKPCCVVIDDVWSGPLGGRGVAEFRVLDDKGEEITRRYSVIDGGRRLEWMPLPWGGPAVHGRNWLSFYRESRAGYVFVRSSENEKPPPTSIVENRLSIGNRVFQLQLGRWPTWLYGNSTVAIGTTAGDESLPQRVLPAGVLPHDRPGLALLERWESAYRSTNRPSWDIGRPSSELRAAVESGELRPCRVVELGCGTGADAVYLAKKGFQVTAVDISPTALRLARQRAEAEQVHVEFMLADVLRLPPMPPADLIYDRGCYHGVRRQAAGAYVETLRKLTLPGAKVLILAGNAEDTSPGGPPRVSREEIRRDFAPLFHELRVSRTRFDSVAADRSGTGAWLVLLERKPFPSVNDLPVQPALPDPLTFFDGSPVRTPEDWYTRRRPELKALFSQYVYGYAPPPPIVVGRTVQVDENVFGGKAVLREVELTLRRPACSVGMVGSAEEAGRTEGESVAVIHLAIFLPKQPGKRFPVFLALNRCGNHAVTGHPTVRFDPQAARTEDCLKKGDEIGRGGETDFWCVEYLIERGYAFATFHQSDVAPDVNDFSRGVHARYSLPHPPEMHWGTIAAWAWGLQRAVDYLIDDPQIDAQRIALIGHSRRGKTALLAAAFDERIALVVPHQSGTGGMALSRKNDQETVERINRSFPHWFNDVFPTFAGREDRLPIDQHLLVALVAPRRVFDTEGELDKWANPDSAWRNLQAAERVWRFLGARGLVGDGPIREETRITPEVVGPIAQYRRNIHHTLVRGFWEAILDFADLPFRN